MKGPNKPIYQAIKLPLQLIESDAGWVQDLKSTNPIPGHQDRLTCLHCNNTENLSSPAQELLDWHVAPAYHSPRIWGSGGGEQDKCCLSRRATQMYICDAALQNKATVHIQQCRWASHETGYVETASDVVRIPRVQLLVRHVWVQVRQVWVQLLCMWVRLCWVRVRVRLWVRRHEQMGSPKKYHGSAKARCVTPSAWGERPRELTSVVLPCKTKLLKKFGGLHRVPMKQLPKDAMENASDGGTSKWAHPKDPMVLSQNRGSEMQVFKKEQIQ